MNKWLDKTYNYMSGKRHLHTMCLEITGSWEFAFSQEIILAKLVRRVGFWNRRGSSKWFVGLEFLRNGLYPILFLGPGISYTSMHSWKSLSLVSFLSSRVLLNVSFYVHATLQGTYIHGA